MEFSIGFMFVLGLFEIFSNLYHFRKKTIQLIGESARKQHRELPENIGNHHFFNKSVIMFIFGILFIITSVQMTVQPDKGQLLFLLSGLSFLLYGITQAIIYRYEWKVWSALIVHAIPLMLYIMFIRN